MRSPASALRRAAVDEPVPAVVSLHVWGVPTGAVPFAVARMGLDRALLRRSRARFWKLLGTSAGGMFRVRDADPRHWAALTAWDEERAADRFARSATVRGWDAFAAERLTLLLAPLSARGRWAGRRPFGEPVPRHVAGPVASLTRARIRPSRARAFWRTVPDVSADLLRAPGLRLALGLGEAPLGWQATFSVWDDADALADFAYRRPAHADAVLRTPQERWFAEELFARFEVLHMSGRFHGRVY